MIHPDQWAAQNSSRAEGKDAGRMQQMWVKQPGKLGQREGGSRETERGPRGVWSIFSFLKWDSDTEAWKLQWQRQTVDFSKLTSHQAAGKQAAGKRNQRFYLCIYIYHSKGLPLPFCLAFQNSPQGTGPLFWGPWGSGLGGSERVLLCPGGGGGGLFLERVELPLEGWVLRGRVEGGPAR